MGISRSKGVEVVYHGGNGQGMEEYHYIDSKPQS